MASEGGDPMWFWDEWQAAADRHNLQQKGWAAKQSTWELLLCLSVGVRGTQFDPDMRGLQHLSSIRVCNKHLGKTRHLYQSCQFLVEKSHRQKMSVLIKMAEGKRELWENSCLALC